MPLPPHARQTARDLIAFIDASPSPWHAVASAEQRLQGHGFTRLEEGARWSLAPGGRHYVLRGGASLIAFTLGSRPLAEAGFRIVGAHTDSPGLRLKPRPAMGGDGLARLAVEVYGGPILATFADRDLSLAGRVMLRGAAGPQARLLRFERPLLRLPNLAIHMNREVNDAGLKFDKQTELPLLLGMLGKDGEADARLRELLAAAVQCAPDELLSWELAAYDVQPGSLWGADEEFIASRQLDNLASCHAALTALTAVMRRQPRPSRPCSTMKKSAAKARRAPAAASSATCWRASASRRGWTRKTGAARWPTASSSAPTWPMRTTRISRRPTSPSTRWR
jgi:aspartyl aminopeptidase